jgi:diguanylate cyclase (GGDEF)-like protein/PAS domain S-box-containing protein
VTNNLNNKTAIQSAQLQQLISVSKVSLVASVSLALILAYIQRQVIASATLVTWFSIVLLASLLRAALVIAYLRFPSDDATVRSRLMKFRLGVLIAGLAWGSASFMLFAPDHPLYQMFLIFTLAGMTAGGVVSFSVDLASSILFSVTVIVPLIIRLFIVGDSLSMAMSAATSVYLAFMILSQWRINRHARENTALRIEATDHEEKIRSSEERYRLLLSHLPVGIFHYGADLVITYCNQAFADIMNNSIERLTGLDMNELKDRSIMVALHDALKGKAGHYEGHYQATYSEANRWISMICAPYRDDSGRIVGGTAMVQDITERKNADETIKSLAFYDPLTNLPNRRLLLDRLQHAMASSARSGKKAALLFIDLDNFKALNDTLGHDMGDLLLLQVAQRLISCVREGDTVARLGGDEFVVMLEDLNEQTIEAAEKTEAIGEKLIATLALPYQLAAHEYRTTSSIGATLFSGHEQTRDELLKQADIAMYQAKKTARNTLRFFDQEMQNAVTARVLLESDLRRAIDSNQFVLYYQIQVDDSHKPVGAEALIRWMHPEQGMVYPDRFIRVAEETEMIVPIGLWVLETACAQIKAWQQEELTRNLIVAVNVSANQFRQPDFVAQVRAAIKRHAIDPKLLNLELTESALLENVDETIATMNALKESGVCFSLDDFGIGYSSLQYLKQLPLDQLKIDRSFVRDIATDSSDKAIVRTIIAMAASLNLGVIAEGVETEEQYRFLQANHCRHYQGYLFGQPVPVEQFDAMLRQKLQLPASRMGAGCA